MNDHIGNLGNEKMRLLERSPMIAPLLAQLQDRNNSYQLSGRHDDAESGELSKTMVELLRLELQPTERELITDVLLELMRQAELDLRQALSERLAHVNDVSLRMVLHLANDEISVAGPILRHSPVLQEMDLVYLIKSHSAEHWQAIAGRRNLSGPVINVLADTGDVSTAVALAENKEITLTDYALAQFVPLAGQSEALAHPLMTRTDVPRDVVAKIYQVVGDAMKRKIDEQFGAQGQVAIAALDDIVAETKQVIHENFMPSANIMRAAHELQANGRLDTVSMLSSLKRGMIASFIAQFAAFAGIDAQIVNDMLMQKTGQSLAVACKAMKVRKADFISFYLMTHRVRQAIQPVIDNQQLSTAIRTYDGISQQDALGLLHRGHTLN